MRKEEWIFFAIVNLLLIIKLAWDWYAKNKQKRVISHSRSVLFDGALYAIFVYIIPLSWTYILTGGAYRWIFFDYFFNKLNGWRWDHYGKTSRIDVFMGKTGKWHIVIKLAVLIFSLWLTRIF